MPRGYEAVVRSFAEAHPDGAARALERLDPSEAVRVMASLPASVLGPVAEALVPHAAGAILSRFTAEQIRNLLEAIPPRQVVGILHHVEEERRNEMLAVLPEQAAAQLRALLKYPEDTAGGMMDPQVVSIPIDVTVQEAISLVRKAPRHNLYYLYVTDREHRLIGVLSLREMILGMPKEAIEPKVRRDIVSVSAAMDREEVAAIMQEKGYLALPVVGPEGRLIGVVKHDEALEAAQEEAYEDLQKLVGAGGDERAISPVSHTVKKRLPWLLVNLVTAFAAAAVVGLFEGIIGRVVALAVLLPVVAGQGGNTGAQALAVVIRGLAVREVLPGVGWRILVKECLAGFVNGLAVAVATGGTVWLWRWQVGDGHAAALGLVIGLSMVVNMVAAGISGAAIPLVLHRLGKDPAQSSTIFLTTVTDIIGFASFLGFALWLLPIPEAA